MRTRNQRGFTLIEIFVALVVVTLITTAVIGSLGPWLSFKEKLDTQRKLQDVQQAIKLAYAANAMTVDQNAAAYLQLANGGQMLSSSVQNGRCTSQISAWQAVSNFLPEGPQNSSVDGFSQPFCIFVSNQLSAPGAGATVYYHNVAVVSLGSTGKLDPSTSFNAETGALNVGGQNTGVLVNGYEIQSDKIAQTQKKLEKLASAYETYFTSQYLSTASRDVAIDYFSNAWDPNGSIPVTNGFTPANGVLSPLGIGPLDAQTPFEDNNTIYVGNNSESALGTSVRSGATAGAPPYTALLYAPLPGPNGAGIVEVVNGNY
jgi:prepilin-type N-terminal cleavage/methylation domain-containing protein